MRSVRTMRERIQGLRVILLTLLTSCLLIATGVLSGTQNALAVGPGFATETSSGVQISLAGESPSTLTEGQSLNLTVHVNNSLGTPLSGAKLNASVSTRPLDTIDAQNAWIHAGESQQRLMNGAKTASTNIPDVASGSAATVTIKVPASELNFSYSMASLPVQIDLDGQGIRTSLNTFTTWSKTETKFTKLNTSVVIPVSLPSDPALFTATGSARYNAWNKAIGPGSAIDKLLSTNAAEPVTWLIDPTLLDPPAAEDSTLPMPASAPTSTPATSTPSNSSASSATPSGSTSANTSSSTAPAPVPTTITGLASRLREKLATRPASQKILFTPYGDPDLSALISGSRPSGADAALMRMVQRPLSASLTGLSTTVVAAPVEPLSASETTRLAQIWQKARGTTPVILTPDATFDGGDSTNSAAQRTASGLSMFGYDSNLSSALTGREGSTTAAISTLQANSLATYQESPTTSRTLMLMGERTSTLSVKRLEAVLAALKNAAWMQVSALDLTAAQTTKNIAALKLRAPSDTEVYPNPGRNEITADGLASAQLSLSNLIKVSGIVTQNSDIVPAWAPAIDQPLSTRYRSHYLVTTELLGASEDAVRAIPQQISVQPTSINFFTDSGQISVTVQNNLQRAVNGLHLHLMPRTYAVQFKNQPAPFSLSPSASTAIRVPMVASAAGQVTISTYLTAANGVELGANDAGIAPTLRINARPTGTWIYWVLGIVAFIVFCYGLIRARNKGTRRRDELARDIQA